MVFPSHHFTNRSSCDAAAYKWHYWNNQRFKKKKNPLKRRKTCSCTKLLHLWTLSFLASHVLESIRDYRWPCKCVWGMSPPWSQGEDGGEEAVYVWQRFHHIFTYSAKTNGWDSGQIQVIQFYFFSLGTLLKLFSTEWGNRYETVLNIALFSSWLRSFLIFLPASEAVLKYLSQSKCLICQGQFVRRSPQHPQVSSAGPTVVGKTDVKAQL